MTYHPISVTELNMYIKGKFQEDEYLNNVLVKGEISNFKHHYTGHMYFTLKDENSLIKCIMFKTATIHLDFVPKDGMKVMVLGTVSVFERDGVYQIYAKAMKQEGVGDLHAEYERLKQKLEQEGLFDKNHKQKIPFMPKIIGVLTSNTGSVIRDIINVSTRRNPNVYIRLFPVPVQGQGAAEKIVKAIEIMNEQNLADVLILARGGGSLEDLWPFNEEIVARAIYNSKLPIISAVGHETDFTIADFVSDLRAPTPSAAAELAVPNIEEIKIKLELITKDIYNYAGCEFNINSPKQLGDILFEKLNLPYGKKNKRGGYTTDADVLKKLVDYPIVNCILEYRALAKLYSTYIDGIINCIRDDGKIHTIYTQTLTRTGRLSSIEPNLQNIPMRSEYGRLIRKAFIPESNSVILSSDYSQIELRVFAHLSGVNDLINAFNEGIDIHTKTAMDIFKVPQEGVTKNMRRQAKAVNFGILYGISSYGLSEDLGIPVKEAKEFINKYFDTYPGVRDYMDKEIETAKKNGYVKTIMNRKRVIDELKSTNYMIRNMGERMALNTPVQGSASDILKKAMVEIDEIFEKENIKSKMLLQVHDELIFNVYNDEIDKVKEIVYNTMTNVFDLKVPLDVDIELGNNWYEAK